MTQNRSSSGPQFGGANCTGSSLNTTSCNTQPCPIDCVWGNWTALGACSVSCGGGNMTQTRSSSGPQFGGANCTGPSSNITSCNTQPCPIDCVWGPFGAFGPCSVSCGGGQMVQTRNNTPPQFGGLACSGSSSNSTSCNTQACPVNCSGIWSNWSACSCLLETQTRLFSILVPASGGGQACSYPNNQQQTQNCTVQSCVPVNCVGSWSPWTNCSCQTQTRSQVYSVSVPAANNGTNCPSVAGQVNNQSCVPSLCPVNCVGAWGAWSNCDCKTNLSTSLFSVSTPAANGGQNCPELSNPIQTRSCLPSGSCVPVNCQGNWSAWSTCNCGSNQSTSVFTITTSPLNGGQNCSTSNNQVKTQSCVPTSCGKAVNCQGSWSAWSRCNCSTNSSSQAFTITRAAANGGLPCNTTQTKFCSCSHQSSGFAGWKIALIVLGIVLMGILAVTIGYAAMVSSASNSFEVV